MRGAIAASCCLLVAACSRAEAPGARPPASPPPVDAARVQLADAMQWPHRRAVEADLDGDGTGERVVLASDVTLDGRGAPIWEDGHRWAVIVEGAGEPTLLYGAFVPNGHVEAGVLAPDAPGDRRHVYVRERTPAQERALVIAYVSPGEAYAVSTTGYQVDHWVPTLAP